jgi:DNA/RNA endonuclease YhcR with UshA esterase domain
MKKLMWVAAAGMLALVLAPATSEAQQRSGRRAGSPVYDRSTEVTLSGTVDEVQSHQGRVGGTGTHLMLATDAGTIDVHLGPTNWLASKEYTFAKGDRIEVTGSKVTLDGTAAIIARQVKRGDQTMVLRNENGIPLWSRRGGTD